MNQPEPDSEIPTIERIACPECGYSKSLSGRGPRFDSIMGEFMIWTCHQCDCEFRVFEFDPMDDGSLQSKREKRRHWTSRLRWKGRRRR